MGFRPIGDARYPDNEAAAQSCGSRVIINIPPLAKGWLELPSFLQNG